MINGTVFLHKTIVWTASNNQYLVLENTTAAILKKLSNGEKVEDHTAIIP